jgi:aromatic-L-amino-acid decarboxylase
MPDTSPSPSATSYPLEPTSAELQVWLEMAMLHVRRHLDTLATQPAADVEGAAAVAARLRETELPEHGRPLPELLDLLFEEAIPKSYNTAGPGYLAYIPGGGIVHAALADFLAAVTNRYVGVWQPAPALVELEANVVRWLCGLAGYPHGAFGILTTGGSLANFSAIVTARRERLPEAFLHGTIYVSDQVHHSVTKAATLAGFPAANVRVVPADQRFRLPPDVVARAVTADRERGLQPFLLVASGGTTNSGAVDDLPALADLAAREGLWFHVDAAYGGAFLLTERGRERLAGLERSDSVVLDPHKGLFLPYGTGCLLVRDGEALRRAHAEGADYLPPLQEGLERPDFCSLSPELSREFRGLRLWLPLKMVGAAAFRDALDEKLDLAREAAAEIATWSDVEIVAPPELSLFAFRWRPAGTTPEQQDDLNRRWMEATNARRRVHLTGTRLAGRFAVRICVLSFRTHRDRMRMALDDLAAAKEELGG